MSDQATLHPASAGLAGLLSALQPRPPVPRAPPPDLDAIRAEGFGAGYVAGEAAAEAALDPLREALAAAAARLDAACLMDAARLRPLLAALVQQVAQAVLMAELRGGAEALLPLVEAALTQVRLREPVVLKAHPETLALLAPHLPDIATAPDADLPRDGFALVGPDFIVDAGLSARLAELMEQVA